MIASQLLPSILGNRFQLLNTLGEGTYGKVKLAMDLGGGRPVAVKVVSRAMAKAGRLETEILIQRNLRHPHMIGIEDVLEDHGYHYIVMEYAAGGELFDKIRMPNFSWQPEHIICWMESRTCIAMGSLIEVEHSEVLLLGSRHSTFSVDLKPENLLLSQNGDLKIADFGLATLFRHKGTVRRLNTVCGTPPYVAPEVLFGDYDGERIDVWSCGVILFVLLSGNTPWDEPSEKSEEFTQYCVRKDLNYFPWTQFTPVILNLLSGTLNIYEDQRATIPQIKAHPWYQRTNPILVNGKCADPVALATRLMSNLQMEKSTQQIEMSLTQSNPSDDALSHNAPMESYAFSQPMQYLDSGTQDVLQGGGLESISFSQPDQDYLTMTQCQGTLLAAARLTRFYSQKSVIEVMKCIHAILDDFLVPHKTSQERKITFSTVDKRKCPLNGEIVAQTVRHDLVLVHFHKGKGDPLEFKRFFQAVQSSAGDFVCSESG